MVDLEAIASAYRVTWEASRSDLPACRRALAAYQARHPATDNAQAYPFK